ncbi:DUF4956 domain-containing protein [candidate division KSB1 bacterium]|nr:DUF4956 domain-containing protein [candidate division KSB1 bacterium]
MQDFLNATLTPITLEEVVINLVIAFLCGLVNAGFYRLIYRGPGYSVSFLNALVALTMITALVIIVIGDNLARAFGLVGAMSIIRFRTAVKEAMDITYIFFALAVGMAAGVGLHTVALAGALVIGLVLLLLTKVNVITPSPKAFLLQFTYAPNGEGPETPYLAEINKRTKSNKLVNVRAVGESETLELSYYIDPKSKNDHVELLRELKRLNGIGQVNLYFDEEQF